MSNLVEGIPCEIESGPVLEALTTVLQRIRECEPEHYARLVERVESIEWLSGDDDDGETGV